MGSTRLEGISKLIDKQNCQLSLVKNYVENDDWFTEFAQRKIDVNEKLDRNFWKTYLNFDVIDAWMKKGKPADEERRHDSNILMCLFYCSMAQNLIEKARNV